jgi:hypothetical protein
MLVTFRDEVLANDKDKKRASCTFLIDAFDL